MALVGVMLDQLILRARMRVLALASITITLTLEGGGEHARIVRPALPSTDKQLWLKLLHLDLEAHPPLAAILSIALAWPELPGSHPVRGYDSLASSPPRCRTLRDWMSRLPAFAPSWARIALAAPFLRTRMHRRGSAWSPIYRNSSGGTAFRWSASRSPALSPCDRFVHRSRFWSPCGILDRRCSCIGNDAMPLKHAYGPWLAGGDWWNCRTACGGWSNGT